MEVTNSQHKENARSMPREEESRSKTIEEVHFFHPTQLSGESGGVLDEKEIEKSKAEIQQKLQGLLRSLSEETLQLSEVLTEEKKLMNELCASIKHVLGKLNVSFSIPSGSLPVKKKAKKVILNKEGNLILVYGEGEVRSAFLADFSPEIVMAVLWVVMPELVKVITLYRKKLSTRVSFFERIKKELKSMVKVMAGSKESTSESAEKKMDVIKDSLKAECLKV